MPEFIVCDALPRPRVPLSHAAKIGNMLLVSGVPPFDKDRNVAADFRSQMRQVMSNLEAILLQAGTTWERVAKMTVVLARKSDYAVMNEIYAEYFAPDRYPARITIEAELARDDVLLEIECIAELP